MKNTLQYMIAVSLVALAACDTEIENIGYQTPPPAVDYEAIRAYRASDHELMFGWFGGWNGGGVSSASSLRSLPDSVDMISFWGDWTGIDQKCRQDMKHVQQVRGVKVLACMFTPRIGRYLTPAKTSPKEYWEWDDKDPVKQEAAIRRYADSVARKVLEFGYDGIDMDNEPEDGNIFGNVALTTAFIETIGKYMGPASGTGKIFAIDGRLTAGMQISNYKHIDYFLSQSYYNNDYTDVDKEFIAYANFFEDGVDPDGTMTKEEVYKALAHKFIVTEDFERHAADGGAEWTLRPIDGVEQPKTRSSLGLALWEPYFDGKPLRKGGAGLYHIENEYVNKVREYDWTRRMIQIMNPASTK